VRSIRSKAQSTMRRESPPSPGRWSSYQRDAAAISARASFLIRRERLNGSAGRVRDAPEPRAKAHRDQRPSPHGRTLFDLSGPRGFGILFDSAVQAGNQLGGELCSARGIELQRFLEELGGCLGRVEGRNAD